MAFLSHFLTIQNEFDFKFNHNISRFRLIIAGKFTAKIAKIKLDTVAAAFSIAPADTALPCIPPPLPLPPNTSNQSLKLEKVLSNDCVD